MMRTEKCAKKSTKLPSNLFEGNISVMGFQCMEYNFCQLSPKGISVLTQVVMLAFHLVNQVGFSNRKIGCRIHETETCDRFVCLCT